MVGPTYPSASPNRSKEHRSRHTPCSFAMKFLCIMAFLLGHGSATMLPSKQDWQDSQAHAVAREHQPNALYNTNPFDDTQCRQNRGLPMTPQAFHPFPMLECKSRPLPNDPNLPRSGKQLGPSDPSFTQTRRIGEADTPGPHESRLTIGQANPSGLRGKHLDVIQLGAGIWSFAETQLTAATAHSFSKSLRWAAKQNGRNIRCHTGAPVTTRPSSSWAGTWSGTMQTSDFPSRPLNLSWPNEHYQTGRLLAVQHYVDCMPITMCSIYGYPRNPTWPRGHELTNELASSLTRDCVIGMEGIRLIGGDFNSQPHQMAQQQIWASYGWKSAQDFAIQYLGNEWCPTNGLNSEIDQLWLSPEAQACTTCCMVFDHFLGHSTIKIELHLTQHTTLIRSWPRPATIPWKDLGDTIPCTEEDTPDLTGNSTHDYREIMHTFEEQIAKQATRNKLTMPSNWQGRAKRLQPQTRETQVIAPKNSREGEISLQCDLVGLTVRQWYKQARRFQSLLHSYSAGKTTINAQIYRAEVWTAIRQAPGFEPSFPEWWRTRESLHPDSMTHLPNTLPTLLELQLFADDFMQHFRRFESWHINQRQQQLKIKYEQGLKQLYQDLRAPQRDTIDILWQDHDFEVIATDTESTQVQLEEAPEPATHTVWFVDDVQMTPKQIQGDICEIPPAHKAEVGSVVTQRIFHSSESSIHTQLLAFWKKRWCTEEEIPTELWQRVTQFTLHHMPKYKFDLPAISTTQWTRAIKKMKQSAARGPDGVSRADLLHLPVAHTAQLLRLIDHIELGKQDWPEQLLLGLITCISKQDDAHEPGHYRPIHLFSVVYRLWASVRTCQSLQLMSQYAPPEAFGFLPGKEATQVWFTIQSWVEVAMQQDRTIYGLSADLEKCFNRISRPQVFHLARHLGVSNRILHPWKTFLDKFQRRFMVRNTVSDPLISSRGFPEGCPLSILAMLNVSWAFHEYLRCYHPNVHTTSYVDNLGFVSSSLEELTSCFSAAESCLELWGLNIAPDKTYSWCTTAEGRHMLRQLDLKVLTDTPELGGSLTLIKALRNRHQRHRWETLDDYWKRLERSRAPLFQKFGALPLVFWPRALHGASICVFSDKHLQDLRIRALQSLHVRKAGTNALLKLTLFGNPCCDPGYFQLQLVVLTFRRMIQKTPDVCMLWTIFLETNKGCFTPGPFYKLQLVLEQIGWHVVKAAWLCDHHGHLHNLAQVDLTLLKYLLHDAWLQYIATQVKHNTMSDLHGLNLQLTILPHKRLPILEKTLVSALQSGAFISKSQQAKFDHLKKALCSVCDCTDDRKHWLSCPRFAQLRHKLRLHDGMFNGLPDCTIYHLLVPKLDAEIRFRQYLCNTDDLSSVFLDTTYHGGVVDLFTDGACRKVHGFITLASWALINATTGCLIQAAPLSGLRQCIGRAELTAIVAALKWGNYVQADLRLWSDSLSTIERLTWILGHLDCPLPAQNFDLWLQVQRLCKDRTHLRTSPRWTPAHLEPDKAEDDFEAWTIAWNSKVDAAAGRVLDSPNDLLKGLVQRLSKTYSSWQTSIVALRDFYLAVAKQEEAPPREQISPIEHCPPPAEDTLCDALPLDWLARSKTNWTGPPWVFLFDLIQVLLSWQTVEATSHWCSDLELIFIFVHQLDGNIPQKDAEGGWSYRPISLSFERPTLTKLLSVFSHCIDFVVRLFDLHAVRSASLIFGELGIFRRVKGTYLAMPSDVRIRAHEDIKLFTRRRQIRTNQDLARPI